MTTAIDTLSNIYLVRYGTVPEVARFINDSIELPTRGACVVVQTDRGLQIGTVLERLKPQVDPAKDSETEFRLVRVATDDDLTTARESTRDCEESFALWCARITQWNLNLELIDLERTLDTQKLILYVLCDRGPDSTKLALQAAAGGFGVVEVQPVASTGLVTLPQSSCGSGGGGCGCSH
ncbi:PSP1 C-terminal domain-containing protein [Schlesneria paludicola]|uniref:PSP1 C-terminal domain-containing protein n=1 Tax=Schlesneria paludicola TaxID=360056 RepID=UPI00029ADFD3|nr:PSP1 C-terminal domain-containing protein [Schlesneria paludicola]